MKLHSLSRSALLSLLLASFALCAHAAEPVHIALIAINDFHGNIQPPSGSVLMPDTANPAGTRVAAGGAAYLSSLVQQLKSQNLNRPGFHGGPLG